MVWCAFLENYKFRVMSWWVATLCLAILRSLRNLLLRRDGRCGQASLLLSCAKDINNWKRKKLILLNKPTHCWRTILPSIDSLPFMFHLIHYVHPTSLINISFRGTYHTKRLPSQQFASFTRTIKTISQYSNMVIFALLAHLKSYTSIHCPN